MIEDRGTPIPSQVVRRFMDGVKVGAPALCWPLKAHPRYVRLTWPGGGVQAHRLSLIFNGRPSGDLLALHSCDNPASANPSQLRVGTHADNALDRAERNQDSWARGERCATAKLSARCGVSEPAITQIHDRKTWSHIDD